MLPPLLAVAVGGLLLVIGLWWSYFKRPVFVGRSQPMWVAFAFGYGSIEGLLTILCLFVADGVLELKAIRRHAEIVSAVFEDVEPQPLTQERAHALTESVMQRVHTEMLEAVGRRVH